MKGLTVLHEGAPKEAMMRVTMRMRVRVYSSWLQCLAGLILNNKFYFP